MHETWWPDLSIKSTIATAASSHAPPPKQAGAAWLAGQAQLLAIQMLSSSTAFGPSHAQVGQKKQSKQPSLGLVESTSYPWHRRRAETMWSQFASHRFNLEIGANHRMKMSGKGPYEVILKGVIGGRLDSDTLIHGRP